MDVVEANDPVAERGVLSGIYQYGGDVYLDIADIINVKSFSEPTNQIIYSCFEHILKADAEAQLDVPSVLSAAQQLGYDQYFDRSSERNHLRAVFNMKVQPANVRKFAATIRKLQIKQDMVSLSDHIKQSLLSAPNDSSIDHLMSLFEGPVLDFSTALNSGLSSEPKMLGDGIDAYLDNLESNPREMLGVSTGYKYFDKAIGGGLRRRTVNMIGARPKIGKAETLDSIVFTSIGPKKMRDIRIGDKVCNADGTYSKVMGVYPQGKKKIYRVTFWDGDHVDCCLDHLWKVKHRRKKSWEVLSVREILRFGNGKVTEDGGKRTKWFIPLPKPCKFQTQKVPLDPYLLGLLIGDGSFRRTVSITSIDEQIIQYVRKCLPRKYSLKQHNRISYRLTHGKKSIPNIFSGILRDLGLFNRKSGKKFVPEIYKINNAKVRLAILQGLMDTDGSVDENGNCEYTTKSRKLAFDVKFLVQSLGGLAKIKRRRTTCEGKFFWSYRCYVKLPCLQLFRLNRKLKRKRKRRKPELKRGIRRISYIGRKAAQCISLASDDGLYLTDNFVVTHNTQLVDNIGMFVANALEIPILNLDTEMDEEQHWNRVLANLSGISVDEIETGKYSKDASKRKKIRAAAETIKNSKYSYISINGKPFEEIISMMRRWVMKKVKYDENGRMNDCLILYDYLKLMDGKDINSAMAEFQVLGFQMTALHNFSHRYDLPVLCFTQLNRDGITKEGTDAASGSDRIIWLCSNFSIFKEKSPDEIGQEGPEAGNRKIVPIVARHGGALAGDHINMDFDGEHARITEIGLGSQIRKRKKKKPAEIADDEDFENIQC